MVYKVQLAIARYAKHIGTVRGGAADRKKV